MGYFYSKTLEVPFQETENKVSDALLDVGFGILTEINIKDAFNEKLGIEHKNYKILGACNPNLAQDAINYEINIGVLMPCNIIIIDNENGTTEIVFPRAETLLEVTDNDNIIKLSIQIDAILKKAFDKIS